MATGQETFTAKLGELEDWYGELRHRVLACQRVDRKALREELKAALEEYREDKVRLQQSVAALQRQLDAEPKSA